ncbi:MAG: tRNA adenosine(34) deaminase TadA [Gammaproteobacteria bacterium]|nr:tRNA adenosine(34) deaminase TadA [Gammaproteobacteria bacterium]
MHSDEDWMTQAIQLAQVAQSHGEVPVGAVVVNNGICVGSGWNQVRLRRDPCAHAEILAIQAACQTLQYERLTGATLYVTLEPCVMCAGAILQARVSRVVFATRDWRAGAAGSRLNVMNGLGVYASVKLDEGVQQSACEQLIQDFFSHVVRNKNQNDQI